MSRFEINYERPILLLVLSLLSGLVVWFYLIQPVRGQNVGLVCVTATTSATGCSVGAPALGPFSVGMNFSVGIFVQRSDAMNAFDIYVRSDPAYVDPISVGLGSLIANPSTMICINNHSGVNCVPGGANAPGVVEVSVRDTAGSNECGGVSPCSGMMFTITYHVVAAVASTAMSYPTNSGCSVSSVSSPPNTCVLVADNLGSTLAENVQGATVATQGVSVGGTIAPIDMLGLLRAYLGPILLACAAALAVSAATTRRISRSHRSHRRDGTGITIDP